MATETTIFQKLTNVFRGSNRNLISQDIITTPQNRRGIDSDRVLFSTSDRNEYERKLKKD